MLECHKFIKPGLNKVSSQRKSSQVSRSEKTGRNSTGGVSGAAADHDLNLTCGVCCRSFPFSLISPSCPVSKAMTKKKKKWFKKREASLNCRNHSNSRSLLFIHWFSQLHSQSEWFLSPTGSWFSMLCWTKFGNKDQQVATKSRATDLYWWCVSVRLHLFQVKSYVRQDSEQSSRRLSTSFLGNRFFFFLKPFLHFIDHAIHWLIKKITDGWIIIPNNDKIINCIIIAALQSFPRQQSCPHFRYSSLKENSCCELDAMCWNGWSAPQDSDGVIKFVIRESVNQ